MSHELTIIKESGAALVDRYIRALDKIDAAKTDLEKAREDLARHEATLAGLTVERKAATDALYSARAALRPERSDKQRAYVTLMESHDIPPEEFDKFWRMDYLDREFKYRLSAEAQSMILNACEEAREEKNWNRGDRRHDVTGHEALERTLAGRAESAINRVKRTEDLITSCSVTIKEEDSSLTSILEGLPDGFSSLPVAVIRDIPLVIKGQDPDEEKWNFLEQQIPSSETDREMPLVDVLATARCEMDFLPYAETVTHNGVEDGYFFRTLVHHTGTAIRILLDESGADHQREFRTKFEELNGQGWIDSIVPKLHRHTRHSIAPWIPKGTTPPITESTQQSRIDKHLRLWPVEGLRSLLLYGDYNTSKTTFAAAYIIDVITYRISTSQHRASGAFHPCVWSINLNEWFDDYLNWRTRDHGYNEVQPPSVTAREIVDTCGRVGLTPVLWIEEFDKVNITDKNRKWLHTLINRIYQMGGCIVVTTNESHKALVKELGAGIMGRLDRSRDGKEGFVCLNF